MFKTFFFPMWCLLGLGLLASCVNQTDNQATRNEEQPSTETVVEEQVSSVGAYVVEGENVDTVQYKGYVFVSQSVPDAVRARMQGKSMKDDARIGYDELRYLTVYHYDYDGNIKRGELVCNQAIAHDLLCVFRDLFSTDYPIYSVRLVDDFDADDEISMQANNTSCFNWRMVPGTNRLSRHAFGMAVDVNPLQNPFVKGARIRPATAKDYVDRTKEFDHKIDKNDYCHKVFTSYGFKWGGNWRNAKDYQHFEKR